MPKLTDYMDRKTLGRLQEVFASVADAQIRIIDGDGKSLGGDGEAAPKDRPLCASPVTVDGQNVGLIELRMPPQERLNGDCPCPKLSAKWLEGFLGMMAGMIGKLWDREKELRARAEELATLYKLSAEFTAQRDVQVLLDLVARTVVEVLNAKACSIRLLNETGTELVIKAVANLSPEYLNKGPILLSRSVIDQEVLGGKLVYIADERTDPRVLYPAEARSEGIVSALCAPMTYKGHPEGVLRVYMDRVHEFDWFEASLLQAVAAEAAAAIVNARLHEEALRSASMKRALQTAAEVQRRMIPAEAPEMPGFEIGTLYVPTFELGGDFYDFIRLSGDNLGLAICDVAGKGVRASLLMASVRASLRAHASNIYDMSHVMERVNRDLCYDTLTSDFATLFYAVLDAGNRRLTWTNAGHMPPLLVRGGDVSELTACGSVIGFDPDLTWTQQALDLVSGDVLVAYTDGLSESMNFDDEPFGRQRIEQAALQAIADNPSPDAVAKHLLWQMRRFTGLQTRFDDVTILVMRVL